MAQEVTQSQPTGKREASVNQTAATEERRAAQQAINEAMSGKQSSAMGVQAAQKELVEAQTALACGQLKQQYSGIVKLPKFCEKYLEPTGGKK